MTATFILPPKHVFKSLREERGGVWSETQCAKCLFHIDAKCHKISKRKKSKKI